MLNIISYILALFFFFKIQRYKISKYNLKLIFPKKSFFEINKIILNSYKTFFFNILVKIIDHYLGEPYLINYSNLKNFNLHDNKIQVIVLHYGLFYDPTSLSKILNNKVLAIYKGNFELKETQYCKYIKANEMKDKFNLINSFKIIVSPIDQKSNDKTIVSFLNKKVNFHSKLVKNSLINKRQLYFIYVDIGWNSLKLNIIKINTKDKQLIDIIQNIADMMTKIILKNPDQYLWLHDRFNVKKTL